MSVPVHEKLRACAQRNHPPTEVRKSIMLDPTRTRVAIPYSALIRIALLGACVLATCPRAALADPSPQPTAAAQAAPLSIPSNILNNPYLQGALNALGGLTQTTNGSSAFGKVTYFKHFELQLQTAPTVYRQIHLHQGTVINPRGSTIGDGMMLQVNGNAQSDGSLNADTITLR